MKFNVMILISFMVLILSLSSVSAIDFGHSAMTVSHSEGSLDVDAIYDDISVAESHAADNDIDSLLVEDSLTVDDSVIDDDAGSLLVEDSLAVDDSSLDEDAVNDDCNRTLNDSSDRDIIQDGGVKDPLSPDSIISILNKVKTIGNNAIVLDESSASFDDLQSLIDSFPAGTVVNLTSNYIGAEGKEVHIEKDITIDGQGHTIDCAGLCRAITSSAGNIILRNLNFINGYVNGNSPWDDDYNGGSIWIGGSAKYTLENCMFKNNYADDSGGAIYSNTVDPTVLQIRNCTFESNKADDCSGGAIYIANGKLNIENSVFRANHADDNGGAIAGFTWYATQIYINNSLFESNDAGKGGGVFSEGYMACDNVSFKSNKAKNGGAFAVSNFILNGCTLESNEASENGGAICTDTISSNLIQNSTFIQNTAKDDGAGIFSTSALKVFSSIFKDNNADDNGGAIRCKGHLDISYSTFENNKAALNSFSTSTFCGGGVCAEDMTIDQCTFTSNSANAGGALYGNKVEVINSNFTSNEGDGGAIYSNEILDVYNALFISNMARNDGGAIYSKGNANIEYCTFDSNKANGTAIYTRYGGAIRAVNLAISDCIFRNNVAKTHGGAIYAENIKIDGRSPTVFEANSALNDNGGAIYAVNEVNLSGAVFNSNTALEDGGAIYCKGNVNLIGCTFDSNKAIGASVARCFGGAICAVNVALNGCVFRNNLAENYGGAIYAKNVKIYDDAPSVFEGNTALKAGGGAICTEFIDHLKHVTFYNNTAASDGGAIYLSRENHFTISQCTIVANHAGDEGGFLYLDDASSGISIINNIVIANTALDGYVVFNKGVYDVILNNWWGDVNPSYDNHLLVEWFRVLSNENKIDSDPLRLTIGLDKSIASVGELVTATAYFIKSDGSRFLGEIPTKDLKFVLPDGIKASNEYKTQNSAVVELVASKDGTYNICVNLHGQIAYVTLINGNVKISKKNNIIPQGDLFTSLDGIESLFESFQKMASLSREYASLSSQLNQLTNLFH